MPFEKFRLLLLMLALLVYGTFSNPTPDSVGPAEISLFALLLLSIGPLPFLKMAAGVGLFSQPLSAHWYRLCAFYLLLTVWLIVGVARNNPVGEMVRDMIAFCFVFLPVLLVTAFPTQWSDNDLRKITDTLAIVGVLLAIRHMMSVGLNISELGKSFENDHTLYLSTDPTVLFAAVYLPLRAWDFSANGRRMSAFARLLFLGGGLTAAIALASKGHRGPLALMAAAYGYFGVVRGSRSAGTAMLLLLAVGLIAFAGRDQISLVIDALMRKQENRGINGRDFEMYAVFEAISGSAQSLALGLGFGSSFYNPAAGGGFVNFAHVFASWAVLKGGFFTAVVMIFYALSFLPPLLRIARRDLSLFLALSCPFVIGALINGSYRMLTFGFLLYVVLATTQRAAQNLPLGSPPPRRTAVPPVTTAFRKPQ
ncbi:MAG: hypothetical protein Q8Q73_11185 [Stagnimonas sp.]|nr:hypothetical protein [Stagnimonas sp.]